MRAEESRQQGLGRIWARHAQRKRQTTARFCRRQRARSSEHFFLHPQSGVSYTFQSANRNKGQVRLDYILTKQADRRLILCAIVRRSPLEAPESDHNLVYAKVRIPRRSEPNRRGTVRRKLRSWPTLGG